MSKPISPVAIGGFTVIALFLLIAGILIFGGGRFVDQDKARYVIYFSSSLNGLNVGAPVKIQGVQVGEVVDIALQIDPQSGKIYKPVIIEIHRNSLNATDGSSFPLMMSKEQLKQERDRLIDAGFRARLEIQSLLTGLLYVNLDIHPDTEPQYVGLNYNNLLEIPGLLATSDEILQTAQKLSRTLQSLPLDEIILNFSNTLSELHKFLVSDDIKQSRKALAASLSQTEQLMTKLNTRLPPVLAKAENTFNATGNLVTELHHGMKPLLKNAQTTLNGLNQAISHSNQAMGALNQTLQPESELFSTLESIDAAARSLKNLTDYLERHPESLISGKAH